VTRAELKEAIIDVLSDMGAYCYDCDEPHYTDGDMAQVILTLTDAYYSAAPEPNEFRLHHAGQGSEYTPVTSPAVVDSYLDSPRPDTTVEARYASRWKPVQR
jgi:hypothetical protein